MKSLKEFLEIIAIFLVFIVVIFFLRELIDELVHNIPHSHMPLVWLLVILFLSLILFIGKRSDSYLYRYFLRFVNPILIIVSIIGLLLSLWRR